MLNIMNTKTSECITPNELLSNGIKNKYDLVALCDFMGLFDGQLEKVNGSVDLSYISSEWFSQYVLFERYQTWLNSNEAIFYNPVNGVSLVRGIVRRIDNTKDLKYFIANFLGSVFWQGVASFSVIECAFYKELKPIAEKYNADTLLLEVYITFLGEMLKPLLSGRCHGDSFLKYVQICDFIEWLNITVYNGYDRNLLPDYPKQEVIKTVDSIYKNKIDDFFDSLPIDKDKKQDDYKKEGLTIALEVNDYPYEVNEASFEDNGQVSIRIDLDNFEEKYNGIPLSDVIQAINNKNISRGEYLDYSHFMRNRHLFECAATFMGDLKSVIVDAKEYMTIEKSYDLLIELCYVDGQNYYRCEVVEPNGNYNSITVKDFELTKGYDVYFDGVEFADYLVHSVVGSLSKWYGWA